MIIYNKNNNRILNKNELNKPLIFNPNILIEILENSENELLNKYLSDELIDSYSLNTLIYSNSSNIYYKPESDEFIDIKDINISSLQLDSNNEYFRIASDSYSIMNLLRLFDEIQSELIPIVNNYKNSVNESVYSKNKIYELIDEILYELYDSGIFNNYFNDKTEYKSYELLYDSIKIKINIKEHNLLENNYICLNDESLDSEIYSLLIDSDLYSSCLYNISNHNSYFNHKDNKEYLSDILDIEYSDKINSYKIFESVLIESVYNESLNTNLEYENSFKSYDSDYSCILTISILDLLKINEIISESDEYEMIFNLNDRFNDNIFNLFKYCNNSIDSDEFYYGIFEGLTESLYNKYYDEYYYELYKIQGYNYHFMKISDIYELIKIILNHFKHYNLNNSFKFNESVYELY